MFFITYYVALTYLDRLWGTNSIRTGHLVKYCCVMFTTYLDFIYCGPCGRGSVAAFMWVVDKKRPYWKSSFLTDPARGRDWPPTFFQNQGIFRYFDWIRVIYLDFRTHVRSQPYARGDLGRSQLPFVVFTHRIGRLDFGWSQILV